MTRPLAVHGALSRGAFAVVVLVSFAVLFSPQSGVPLAPPGTDKVVHFGLFAALAVTGRWAGAKPSVLAGLLVLYAAFSEVLQGVLPLGRSATLGDFLADSAGVLVGLVAWRVADLRRSRV